MMRLAGPWTEQDVWSFAESAVIPAKIACIDGNGWPTTASMWFLPEDGSFWCATPASSNVARWLRDNPRCAIEIAPDAPPYQGIRARGRATLMPDPDRRLLRRLIQRYLESMESSLAGWLLKREVEECVIRIEPLHLSSWDFSARMQDAIATA